MTRVVGNAKGEEENAVVVVEDEEDDDNAASERDGRGCGMECAVEKGECEETAVSGDEAAEKGDEENGLM
jgi:hypothetical protein